MPLLSGRRREHHGAMLRHAAELADAGLLEPRLDPRRYTLDTVTDAHESVESGTAAGKVVVTIASGR
jgi:NADPH:quinone reductase-like Zn-dependent oxidoreductase